MVGFIDDDLCGIFEMEVVSGSGHEVIMLSSFCLLISVSDQRVNTETGESRLD